jgi:PelA/Pel-15E family pectate lyase
MEPRAKMSFRANMSVAIVALAALAGSSRCAASVIGINPPAQSLTRSRIAQLPASERAAWLEYLDRSEKQRHADKEAFRAELTRAGIKTAIEPPHSSSARSIPLDRERGWYAGADARHIADVILSFQTPAGGWGKNLDMSKEPRQPGEKFGPNNLSQYLSADDFDTPVDPDWNYIGTIDNDATTTQLKFLAMVIGSGDAPHAAEYRASFLRGIDYLLAAQYPNGGWPQVWPLEGGYHDAITYNDNAVTESLEVLDSAARGGGDYAFVPVDVRRRAAASFAHGIDCILKSQIVVNAVSTGWPQQDDALMLQPVSARNFEMPALSAGESAGILILLMDRLPRPTAAEQHAIRTGAAWLRKSAIYGESWQRTSDGRGLVPDAGAGPIWARYYQIETNMPIFGDRDKTIHDDVKEISKERRNGYAWYSPEAQKALDRFATWSQQYPEKK